VFGWAMYDFANSGYTTVVITAVFAAYFVGGVADGAPWATLAWTLALGLSNALVLLIMPGLGAWADAHGAKRRVLAACTVGCVLGTAALAAVGPGDVALALALLVLSNTFFAMGESMASAFLPALAPPQSMGRVSGWGWSLGYAGGMLTLGLSLAYVLWAQAQGLPAADFVPVTMGITAALFALAAGVTFALLQEHPSARAGQGVAPGLRQSLLRWRQVWQGSAGLVDFRALLRCTVAYQAGVAVAIALAAIYAEQVIGFAKQETMLLIFVLNIAALLGALAFGYVQDALGHRRTLAITLLGWVLTCVLAALAQDKALFWWAAGVAGLCMGSSQSAGRAMVGLMVPRERLAEYYGLWGLAVRLASILGPMMYGLVTWVTAGNHRMAIMATTGFFLLGLWWLRGVDVARGQRAAESA